MSTFTMELRHVIEHLYGTSIDPDDYVQEYTAFTFEEVTYGKLPTVPNPTLMGLGTYPIFNEAYRPILNGKIIDEYYTREIGTETIDNWTLMIRRKMDQIMPYYNKLYLSERIPYEALSSIMIHTVLDGNTDEVGNTISHGESTAITDETANTTTNTSGVNDTTSAGRNVSSATPQTMLSGNEDYATSATDSNSSAHSDSTTDQTGDSTTHGESNGENDLTTDSTNNVKEDKDSLTTGYQGAASDLINKYRNTLLNIDTSIILELQDCFMALLNNGDAYSPNNYYGWVY